MPLHINVKEHTPKKTRYFNESISICFTVHLEEPITTDLPRVISLIFRLQFVENEYIYPKIVFTIICFLSTYDYVLKKALLY